RLRLHQPSKWRRRFRAFLRYSSWRLQEPARRPNRAVRRDQRPQRLASGERYCCLGYALSDNENLRCPRFGRIPGIFACAMPQFASRVSPVFFPSVPPCPLWFALSSVAATRYGFISLQNGEDVFVHLISPATASSCLSQSYTFVIFSD